RFQYAPGIRGSDNDVRNQLIKKKKNSMQLQDKLGSLGLIILIDVTKSMDNAIEDMKKKIDEELATELLIRYPRLKGKVAYACIGYRDICDRVQFEVMGQESKWDQERSRQQHFKTDVKEVQSFLSGLKAQGGGDYPEDIAGALLEVSRLNFDAFRSHVLFHIFDDPGHGKEFNDYPEGHDKYMDYIRKKGLSRKDPAAEIEEAITKLKQECNVVKYHAMAVKREDNQVNPSQRRH
ncbi:hypothetical protein DUNSADRAFT_9069, partial [Dunaliella salina]